MRELGILVREVAITQEGTLNYDDFAQKINKKNRLVAIGYTSNAFGTANDVKKIRQPLDMWTA